MNIQARLVSLPCSARDSQESSPTPQFESISSLVLSFLYGPTLTSVHDNWKTIALTIRTFVGKVMPLLNTLSRFVVASLKGYSLVVVKRLVYLSEAMSCAVQGHQGWTGSGGEF